MLEGHAVLSRARIKALIETGQVVLAAGGTPGERPILEPSTKVKSGQSFLVTVPEAEAPEPLAEDIPLDIIYEDDDLIVIDKPAGLVVHPAPGHPGGTLVNALIAHCGDSLSGIGGVRRPGIVHRIDKDTSGLLVVAKNDMAHQSLSEQFSEHSIERTYTAVCWQAPRPRSGTIDAPLGRSRTNRKKMAVVKKGGRDAVTRYTVIQTFGLPTEPAASIVECRLETGRTHQIRVHMTHIGHPIIGDPVYGRGRQAKGLGEDAAQAIKKFGRQALHASLLGFRHPGSSSPLKFESKLPYDMNELIAVLTKL